MTGTVRRSVGLAADNTYYAQLTTGQTMRNNILVCDANNSIIASKWEIRTQFALRCSVNPLYILHFHCITYTFARAHTRTTIAIIYTHIIRVCVCVSEFDIHVSYGYTFVIYRGTIILSCSLCG